MTEIQLYRTNDMGMTAFLRLQGHSVQHAEAEENGTVYFHFFPTDTLLEHTDEFISGRATVEPKAYNREYGAVKSLFQTVRHRH
jgi:hypothetical protein